jgi:hypothetical protein
MGTPARLAAYSSSDLPEQPADALHRELVVDHAHDPGELDPFKQWLFRVSGQREYPVGEAQPAQLTVDQRGRRIRCERSRL